MTYQEVLDSLALDPHAWRYRELTAEDFHDPEVRDEWRERLVRVATGGQPELIVPASPPDPWLPLIRACEHYNPACCTNPAPWCSRFNLVPTREKCIECLTADGIGPGNASPALSEKETNDGKPDEVDTV